MKDMNDITTDLQKREVWIDYSKLMLINLVVVAHTEQITKTADTLICGFHMLVFFHNYISKMIDYKADSGAWMLLVPSNSNGFRSLSV